MKKFSKGWAALPLIGLIAVSLVFVNSSSHKRRSDNIKFTADTTSSQTTATQYLDIKEWGVELPLTSNVSDAYYVVPQGISLDADGKPSGVYVTSASLTGSCGNISTGNTSRSIEKSVGEIVRVLPTATDPVTGKLYTQELPDGVTVDDYYYGYSSNLSNNGCASTSTLQSIDSSFSAAVKSIAPEPSATN